MLKNIKGAVFDMDGTLIDSLMLWDVVWTEFGKCFMNGERFRPTEHDEKAIRTMTLKEAMNYLNAVYKIGNSGEELSKIANKIMKNFYSSKVNLKKGVLEFLEYCYTNNIKMCIASASEMELIKIAVKHCGIEKYFVDILSCAEIGKGKEQPDIYLKALASLGTSNREEICVFEDSYIAIDTANRIGMKTVGIYDRYNYGQEEIKETAMVYIAEGETLGKLIANADF